MIKTTGAEFKAFYTSDWDAFLNKNGCWVSDDTVVINNDSYCGDVELIPDDTTVRIETGVIMDNGNNEICDYQAFFRKWKKAQTTTMLVVQVPNDYVPFLKDAIKNWKGKVL